MATLVVGGIVLLVIIATIWKMVSDKRKGKGSCGGNCASCHSACGR